MRAIRATVVQPVSDTGCRVYPDGVVLFNPDGRIAFTGNWPALQAQGASPHGMEVQDARNSLLLPGFYDLHFHWVQDQVRRQSKASLLEWLEQHAFPAEMRFADAELAEARARDFWPWALSQGLVGGLVYSSIHPEALAAALRHASAGFHLGNVLMTMHSPPALTTSPTQARESLRTGLKELGQRYVVSPRFAPATDPETMRQGARLAVESGCFMQTHLAETPAETAWALNIYRSIPGFHHVCDYTDIYDRCGLLGPRSVFGHGIFLSARERSLLADSGSIIAHCPTSNAPVAKLGLGSGLFDFRAADAVGLRWGLASDIGAGPYLSPLDVMASFVDQNRQAGITTATPTRALYRATAGNAALLGRDASLEPGSPATFVLLQRPGQNPPPQLSGDADALLQPILDAILEERSVCEQCMAETWINGQRVFART